MTPFFISLMLRVAGTLYQNTRGTQESDVGWIDTHGKYSANRRGTAITVTLELDMFKTARLWKSIYVWGVFAWFLFKMLFV